MGCRTEVIAFGKTSSGKLKLAADMFVDLDRNRKYLIRGPMVRVTKAAPKADAKAVPKESK
jgi:hypothetical protein